MAPDTLRPTIARRGREGVIWRKSLIVSRRSALLLVVIVAVVVAGAAVLRSEAVRTSATWAGLAEDVERWRTARFIGRSEAFIEEYMRTHEIRRLQIGAGSRRWAGWLNTDIEEGDGLAYLDAMAPFPLPDASFHYVASEHVIEHLPFEGGEVKLAETFRVLAPGGKVRIATPNLLRFVALFGDSLSEEERSYRDGKVVWHDWPRVATPECVILNLQMSSWGHRFLYDPETLRAGLERAGFEDIRMFELGESDDPYLQGIEGRLHSSMAHLNAYETMVLQATKPARATGGRAAAETRQ
jgi:predicted SAM-dependent methyltransferase